MRRLGLGESELSSKMKALLISSLLFACLCRMGFCSEYLVPEYDVQIHPTHGHGHYGDHGFATSIRYDTRHHLKVPDYGHHDDVIYQYVSDHHHLEDEHLY